MFKNKVLSNEIVQNDIKLILEKHIKRKSSKNIIKQMLDIEDNYFSLYIEDNKFLIEFSIYNSTFDYYILCFHLWKFDKRLNYYKDHAVCLEKYYVGFTKSLEVIDKPYKHSDSFDSEDSWKWCRLV